MNTIVMDSTAPHLHQDTGTKASIIRAATEVFARQIQQWDRKRAPRMLEPKLTAARNADQTTTARILLDHGGFVAWLAYFLATEGTAHFNGRLRQDNSIKAFRALPFNDRVRTARHLAHLKVPSAAEIHIRRIRRRLEDKGKQFAATPSFLTRSGLLTDPHEEARQDSTVPIDQTSTESCGISLGSPDSTTSEDTATSASLEGTASVFGEYMYGVVRRVTTSNGGMTTVKAAVTMQFPGFALHDCVMMLEICETEVEHLVKDLFGINVVSVMGIRHLTLAKGVKLTSNVSNPEITLKGVRDEAIIRILGPEIHEAIIASRMRKRELEEGNSATECVSMIFTCKSGEGAYMNVCIALEGGLRIRDKLYRKYEIRSR